MQSIQLFVYDEQDLVYKELDVIETEIIRFTKQVSSIEDPEIITSNYTNNFRLPQTPVNGEYFKAVFNVNGVDYDATKKVPAYINIDGALFTSGDLRLNQIYRNDKKSLIEYDVLFIGETGGFGGAIGSKLMGDLDLSDTSHVPNYSNITLSWDGYPSGLFGGKILYPLAEWGYNYITTSTQPIPAINTVSKSIGPPTRGFTISGNPLLLGQFKPILSVKYLFDKILSEAGYTYTSNFINTNNAMMMDMYHVSTGPDTSGPTLLPLGVTGGAISSFLAGSNALYIAFNPVPVPYIIPTNTPSGISSNYDPFNLINTGNVNITYNGQTITTTRTFFKIANTGQYQINLNNLQLYFVQGIDPGQQFQNMGLYIYVNGVQFAYQQGYFACFQPSLYNGKIYSDLAYSSLDFTFPSPGLFYTFNAGDEIELRINREQYVSGDSSLYLDPICSKVSLIANNDPFQSIAMFPSDYKQIDFIRSLSNKFKLIWEPDPQNPKNFYIEPWINWIKSGNKKDWSNKLNENVDIVVKPLFQTQPRTGIWKDLSESDVYNFSFQQEFKRTFGETILTSPIEIIEGTRKIETKIAPIQLAPMGYSETFLVPQFSKNTENERQPIEVTPRFCFYNGLIDNPVDTGATGNPQFRWYMVNDSFISTQQNKYPLISNYYGKIPFGGEDFDISWSNVRQFWDPAKAVEYGNGTTNQTAFNNYWGDWYNMVYDPYSRIVEAEFALETNDIRELRFNDRIWVKDCWYFPLEIKDFVLNEKQNAKVKLMKVGDIGINDGVYPEREFCFSSTNSCDACCCVNTITVYGGTGPSSPLPGIQNLYLDPQGNTPAPNGWYNELSSAISYYFMNGIQNSSALCSGCSCTPVLFPATVCKEPTALEVCCCPTPNVTVYGNGLSISTSTQIWANSAGTAPLTPFSWVREATGDAAQVGADGHTVVQYNNCSGVVC